MSVTAFAIAPVSIATDRRLGATDIRTLLGLLSFTTPDRLTCWPSRRTLAERIGVSSVSRISATLGRLQRLGWIEIEHRTGSSRYTITPPGAPPDPVPPVVEPPVHPVMDDLKGLTEVTIYPLTPDGGEELAHIEIDIHPALAELPVIAEETQVEAPAEPVHNQPTASEPRQARSERIEAGQRVVEHINAKTGSQLDTRESSATVRRAARRLRHFTERELIEVIESKGREFRHPAALLKPSVIEAILSERRQRETAEQRRRQREVETLAQVRPVAVNPEAARGALSAIRKALGVRLTC